MAKGTFEVEPGVFMQACCHHRRRAEQGACGACYARLYVALEQISKARTLPVVARIARDTHAAMRAGRPERKAARHG